ncbi:MAG: insulinase family protein [Bacteroidota bacterium]|nr:insulinase family protein [Bacteroidota bacterium]
MNTKLIFFLVSLLLTFFSFAQTPVKKNKHLGNSSPVVDLKQSSLNYEYALNDPLKTRIYTLKNGMKVYLSVYKDAPRIQTFIAVKAGSKNDPPNATGLAHYLEHMVFKGTDVYGTKDFKKEEAEIKKIENLYEVYRQTKDEAKRKIIYHQIDSVSGVAAKYAIANEYDKMLATIGANGTNAFTSFDQTVYVNDIPSNQIDTWLKIEAERFRKPVLRLFHTELEAVYEEKNRSLDNDNDKVYDAIMSSLFKNHTYGTQTTIGTIDHLKNPSLIEINKFYNKYYVPNNMAIIMSGDFDPDKVIVDIEKHFGSYASKPVEDYNYKPEEPITSKIVKTVVGPDPTSVNLGWRVGGEGSTDADMGDLMASILYNGTAGLMDINLNQAQKVLSSNNIFYVLKDYALFGFTGEPKEGQSLEEVEQLLLSQIELVKKGEFPDWLLQAVITDLKLRKTKELEQNYSRASEMLDAFVNNIKWQKSVDRIERISKITKKEIVDFANKNFTNSNYVVVYKKTGENAPTEKVVKPAITPIEVDRNNTSKFVQNINATVPAKIEPKFLDYEKDILKSTLKSNIQLLYNKNTENKLFELYYKFDIGKNNDKLLPIAIKYIPYLAIEGMDAAKIKQEFYRLGCSFNVFSDNENTWISLVGLNDNFEKALKLFEKMLDKPVVDETVLKNLLADVIKSRNDLKLQKGVILNSAMLNYARYGSVNPFSHVLTDEEINKITVSDIKNKIRSLTSFEHRVLYYGPNKLEEVKSMINSYHNVPEKLTATPPLYNFVEKPLDKTVYVIDFDMTQVEILMLSNGIKYDPKNVPIIALYNNYFGGGMSSIVFQDLRESKALAYSTGSGYNQPNKANKNYFNSSYIGSQADKLSEAIKGLSDLLNNMPRSEAGFNSSRELILQEMRTQRITKSEIFFSYLSAENMGNKTDIRKDIYEKVQNYKLEDIQKFQKEHIQGKPITVLVLGKKENLDLKVLEKYGTVKFLTLKEVFGY